MSTAYWEAVADPNARSFSAIQSSEEMLENTDTQLEP